MNTTFLWFSASVKRQLYNILQVHPRQRKFALDIHTLGFTDGIFARTHYVKSGHSHCIPFKKGSSSLSFKGICPHFCHFIRPVSYNRPFNFDHLNRITSKIFQLYLDIYELIQNQQKCNCFLSTGFQSFDSKVFSRLIMNLQATFSLLNQTTAMHFF